MPIIDPNKLEQNLFGSAEKPQYSVQQFAAAVKKKYPVYQGQDDTHLTHAITQKYPNYASWINAEGQKSLQQHRADLEGGRVPGHAATATISAQPNGLWDRFKRSIGEIPVGANRKVRDIENWADKPFFGLDQHEDASPTLKRKSLTVVSAMSGMVQGFGDIAKGITTPENVGLIAAFEFLGPYRAARMLVDIGFSVQMAKGAIDGIKAGNDAWQAGDGELAIRYWTSGPVSTALAVATGAEAVKDARAFRAQRMSLRRLNDRAVEEYGSPWRDLSRDQKAAVTYKMAAAGEHNIFGARPQSALGKYFDTRGIVKENLGLGQGAVGPFESFNQHRKALAKVGGDYSRHIAAVQELNALGKKYRSPGGTADDIISRAPEKRGFSEAPTLLDGAVLTSDERLLQKQDSLTDWARSLVEAERRRREPINAQEEKDQQRQEAVAKASPTAPTGALPAELQITDRRTVVPDVERTERNKQHAGSMAQRMEDIAHSNMFTSAADMERSLLEKKPRGKALSDTEQEFLHLSEARKHYEKTGDFLNVTEFRTQHNEPELAHKIVDFEEAAAELRRAAKESDFPADAEEMKVEAQEAQGRAEELKTERDKAIAARAAQMEKPQVHEVGAPVRQIKGRAGDVILPDKRKIPFHYAVVALDDLVTSHNPLNNFEPVEEYPEPLQPRDYKNNQAAQGGVIAGGNSPEPALVMSNAATGHEGPPIVREDGVVAGGNGRAMRLKLAYRQGHAETLREYLAAHAADFGLTAEQIPPAERQPVLVRVLDDPVTSREDLIRLGQDLNRTETMGFDEAETAVASAQRMPQDVLEWAANALQAMGEGASIRDLLRTRNSEIVDKMTASGLWDPTKRAEYVTREGELTNKGKELFENALFGKVIDDAALLSTTPASVLNKLDRSLAALATIRARSGMWDLTPELKDALRLWKRVDSVREHLNDIGDKGDSLVDKYLHPDQYKMGSQLLSFGGETVRETPHPTTEAIAKLLEKNSTEVKTAFQHYADDAEGKQQSLLEPPSPRDSFNRNIAEKVKIEVAAEDWGTLRPVAELKKTWDDAVVKGDIETAAGASRALESKGEAAETPIEQPATPPADLASTMHPVLDEKSLRSVLGGHPGFTPDQVDASIRTLSGTAKLAGVSLDEFLKQRFAGIVFGEQPPPDSLLQMGPLPPGIAEKIRAGGAEPVERFSPEFGNLVLFNDPETKTTLALKLEEVTAEAVRRHMEASRKAFKESKSKAAAAGFLYQGAKGAVEFLPDGRAIMHLMASADVSTLFHEFFHIARRALPREDLSVLEQHFGVKDGKWTRAQEELSARQWERYLYEGKSPTAKLKGVFEKIKAWMGNIYASLKGSPIGGKSLHPQVRQVFDRIFTGGEMEAPPEKTGEMAPPPTTPYGVSESGRKLTPKQLEKRIAELDRSLEEFPGDIADREGTIEQLQYFLDKDGDLDNNDYDGLMRLTGGDFGEEGEGDEELPAGKLSPQVIEHLKQGQVALRQEIEDIKVAEPQVREERDALAKLQESQGGKQLTEAPTKEATSFKRGQKVVAQIESSTYSGTVRHFDKNINQYEIEIGDNKAVLASAADIALDTGAMEEPPTGDQKSITVPSSRTESGGDIAESYSADTIGQSGKIRRIVTVGGKQYVAIGGVHGKGLSSWSLARVFTPEEWGDKPTFDKPHSSMGTGYAGTKVKFRGKDYVLGGRDTQIEVKGGGAEDSLKMEEPPSRGRKSKKPVSQRSETQPTGQLVAEGGEPFTIQNLADAKRKEFADYDEATRWAMANKDKLESLRIYQSPDGKAYAQYLAKNRDVLLQSFDYDRELAKVRLNSRIHDLKKQLDKILPEASRIRMSRELRDLETQRTAVTAPARLSPPPGAEPLTLFGPSGEEIAHVEQTPAAPERARIDDRPAHPEPRGTGEVPKRAERPVVSRAERAPARAVRASAEGGEPGGAAGDAKSALRNVPAASLDAPLRARGEAIYSADEWKAKTENFRLPENAPPPTVRLPEHIRRLLIFPGQPEVAESALSGLQQHDAYIIATSTGTGKTYLASAILSQMHKPGAYTLLVTPSKNLIHGDGGLIQVAEDFGVHVEELPPATAVPDKPGVYATTYTTATQREGITSHPWDFVVADEIQDARKWYSSARGAMTKTLAANAKKIMYMSATPFHTALELGHMEKLGLWRDMGFAKWGNQFGIYQDGQGNWAGGNAPRKLAKLREQLIERGQMINMDRIMDGYRSNFAVVPVDPQTSAGVRDIDKAFRLAENYFIQREKRSMIRATKGNAVTFMKNYLERQRLPQAIEIGKQLEKDGWKVIFFSENKKGVDEVFDFLKEPDNALGGQLSQLLPKLPSVTEQLQAAFGEDMAIFAGPHSAAREAEKNAFNNGEKKHIYASYAAGGVGVSLHDKKGDAPRAAIYLGPPWSGISLDQAIGRPWRFGTKSDVHAIFLLSNSKPEMDLVLTKIAPRLSSLRALVSGIHENDPLVKSMNKLAHNRDGYLDFSFGNAHKAESNEFLETVNTDAVVNYKALPIISAETAKHRGMKFPGQTMEPHPSVVRLFQEEPELDLEELEDLDTPAQAIAGKKNLEAATHLEKGMPSPFVAGGEDASIQAAIANIPKEERGRLADAMASAIAAAIKEQPEKAEAIFQSEWRRQLEELRDNQPPGAGKELLATPDEVKPEPRDTNMLQWLYMHGLEHLRRIGAEDGAYVADVMYPRFIDRKGEVGGEMAGEFLDLLHKHDLDMKGGELFNKAWMVTEGKASATTAQETALANDLRDYMGHWQERLQDAGVMVESFATGRLQFFPFPEKDANYLPHRYPANYFRDKRQRAKVVQSLMERYGVTKEVAEDELRKRQRTTHLAGHVERARELDIDGYRTDPGVILEYISDSAEAIARTEVFGQRRQKLDAQIAKIPKAKNREKARTIMDQLLMPKHYEPEVNRFTKMSNNFVILAKMPFSALPALSQTAKAGLFTNTQSMIAGIAKVVKDYKGAYEGSIESGAITDVAINAYRKELAGSDVANKYLTAVGFNWSHLFGRMVADEAGKTFIERSALPRLMKDPQDGMRGALKRRFNLGDDQIDAAIKIGRWTDADLKRAGRANANLSQHAYTQTELPPGWSLNPRADVHDQYINAFMQPVFLLHRTAYRNGVLLKKALWDEAVLGNKAGAAKNLLYLGFAVSVFDEILADAYQLATGRTTRVKQLMTPEYYTGSKTHLGIPVPNLVEREIDNLAFHGGLGLAQMALQPIRYKIDALQVAAGPFYGAMADWADSVINAFKDKKLETSFKRMWYQVKRTSPATRIPMEAYETAFGVPGESEEGKNRRLNKAKKQEAEDLGLTPTPSSQSYTLEPTPAP